MHPAIATVRGGAVGLRGASVGAAPAHEHVDEAELQIPVRYRSARQVILFNPTLCQRAQVITGYEALAVHLHAT